MMRSDLFISYFAQKRVIKIWNMLKAIFRLITVAAPTRTVFLILHSLAKGMANHVTFFIFIYFFIEMSE